MAIAKHSSIIKITSDNLLDSTKLAEKIADLMSEKQAEDIIIIDLRGLTSIADYFVISTGTVDVHLKAIVDHTEKSLRILPEENGIGVLRKEGYSNLYWVLLDYGTVVAHVFQPDAREYYKLENLWGDAPRIKHSESL